MPSHALKSCDSVKGSLWGGGTVLSRLLAGTHFLFIEMSPEEKEKENVVRLWLTAV